MTSMKSLLLASSALLATATIMPAHAAPAADALTVAQAQGNGPAANKKAPAATRKAEDNNNKKKADEATKPGKKEGKELSKPAGDKNNQADDKGGTPQKAESAQPSGSRPPATAQQKQPAQADKAPATAAGKNAPEPDKKAAASEPGKKASEPDRQAAPASRTDEPKQQPAAQQQQPGQKAARQKEAEPRQQPAEQQQPAQPATRQAAPAPAVPSEPAQSKDAEPAQSKSAEPAKSKSAEPAPGGDGDAAAATAQQLEPAKRQDARDFIRKDDEQPRRTIKEVRQQRRTTREEGRTFIHEGDRVIVRGRNRTFIRHNEERRFAIGARDVRTNRRNGETVTVILRPNGVRIITVTDRDGHLIRRVRRDPNGRDVVIIDNRRAGRRDVFLDVRPPRIGMPRHRYIVDIDTADRREIYDLLVAPPIQTIESDYSLAQVRYNAPLREYMRRLDLNIQFDTGSWQITPAQMDRLSVVAEGLKRAIERDPREVFLIEGHTDAVGSQEDNLSLSDRRAEAVAVALTEIFKVPPENLVTQGYGEQELEVKTQGPSRANRRVALRRITPLINRMAQR